jgi:heptosyltransferase-2
MVHYYLEVARATALALGAQPDSVSIDERPPLVLPVNPDAAERVQSLFRESSIEEGTFVVGINPGAAYGGAKRWVPERLAAVADALAESHAATIICTSIKREAALADAVEQSARCLILRMGERVDLQGLAALMARMSLFITNDSGAMHIAAAIGTPTVAIFGPTDWNVTSPWTSRAIVVRESPDCAPCFLRECPIDHRCMGTPGRQMAATSTEAKLQGEDPTFPYGGTLDGVSVEMVLAAAERLLASETADHDE